MASPFEEDKRPLNGYDVEHTEESVIVRCTANGVIRAAVAFGEHGEVVHVAREPGTYGDEAMAVLALVTAT